MARPKSHGSPKDSSAHLGFEAKLWLSADTALRDSAFLHAGGKLQVLTERQDNFRNNMDAAEYSRAERDSQPQAARRVKLRRQQPKQRKPHYAPPYQLHLEHRRRRSPRRLRARQTLRQDPVDER